MSLYRKTIVICLIIILVFSSNVIGLKYINKNKIFDKSDVLPLLDGSYVESYDGFKVLNVNGSYYEMGYQHGYLLKKEVNENIRAFIEYANRFYSYDKCLEFWNITKQYMPKWHLEEMQGLADGAEVSMEELGVTYMIPLHIMDIRCMSYAAWSNATVDGKLYHVRSDDFPVVIKDSASGHYIQENSVVIIRNPEGGYRSVCPSFAGFTSYCEGFNQEQVSISIQGCISSDKTIKGVLVLSKIEKALDSTSNAEQALDILTSNKTLGWNFIVCDSKKPRGYAVEVTSNYTYVGTWNNSIEGKYPFWQIEHVVRRTNFFIDPEMSQTQRSHYNPSGIISFLKIFVGSAYFPLWRKYRAMSLEIEDIWGDIDLNSSISILRKVYSGKTDLLMYVFLVLSKNSILCDIHQWAACPETGDFVISFADADSFSHENKLYSFNICQFS